MADSGRIRTFIEPDGIALVVHSSAWETGRPPSVRYRDLAGIMEAPEGVPLSYAADEGDFTLHLRIEDDIVARAAQVPPRIARDLEQAAVDAILEIGSTPDTRDIDLMLRRHAETARVYAELRDLADRQASNGWVGRRSSLEGLRDAMRGQDPIDHATALLGSLPVGETRGGPGGTPAAGAVEQGRITALLEQLANDVAGAFEALIARANARIEEVFAARAGASRDSVPPQHRPAYDAAVRRLRAPGDRALIFIRPEIAIERASRGGRVVLRLRRHTLAHLARFGGFQSLLDAPRGHPALDELIGNRVAPLWVRIYEAGSVPRWQADRLQRQAARRSAPT